MLERNRWTALLTTSISLALPVPLDAQLDPQRPAGGDAVPFGATAIHTAAADGGIEYGIWASGAAYKVSFHDGATVVPYLGRGYERNQDWRWRTVSATVGETELCTQAPRLSYSAFRAEYDLGGIVEAWDVRDEGVEQTFVLTAPPGNGGELVIRGLVTGPLSATDRGSAHGDVLFHDAAGNAVLRYGAATAIDARGDTRPMTTAVDGGEVTLRLDAGWLRAAQYPVVVDPLVGIALIVQHGAPVGDMAMTCTYLPPGDTWHAQVRWASATDADLEMWRVDYDGNNRITCYTDLASGWSSITPDVGQSVHEHATALVFARHFSNGSCRLRFHRHEGGSYAQTHSITFVDTGSDHAWRPRVSSNLNIFSPLPLVVVFQVERGATFGATPTSAIFGVEIDLAVGSAGAAFRIMDSSAEDYERPDVTDVHDAAQHVHVAWQAIRHNSLTSPHVDWDIEFRRVGRNASSGPVFSMFVGNGFHEMAPRLAGQDDDFFVACMRARPGDVGSRPAAENGHRVRTWPVHWHASGYAIGPGDAHYNEADARLVLTGFDFDRRTGSHALFTLRSTVTNNVYLRLIGYTGAFLRAETVTTSQLGTNAGAVAFHDGTDGFQLAYNSTSHFAVFMNRYEHVAAGPLILGGVGCSPATLDWHGTQLIGDAGSEIRMIGGPAGALGTILVAFDFINQPIGLPIVHPGCWLNVPSSGPSFLATMPIGFGDLAYAIDLPEWLGPGTLFFQGVHFDAAATEVFTTQRLAVPFAK